MEESVTEPRVYFKVTNDERPSNIGNKLAFELYETYIYIDELIAQQKERYLQSQNEVCNNILVTHFCIPFRVSHQIRH